MDPQLFENPLPLWLMVLLSPQVSAALTQQQLVSVVQNVAEVRRHHDLHQALQLVILHTGTPGIVDSLTWTRGMEAGDMDTDTDR